MGTLRSCVILAGGAGRRIGSEKAFLEFFGLTMIERTFDLVGEVVDDVVVVARDEDQLKRLRDLVPEARLACDSVRGFGPVAGLAAGMAAARGEYALAVGCDLPFLKPEVLEILFDFAEGYDAAIPSGEGGLVEPLHAVYRADSMARACEEALAMGMRRIRAPLEELRVKNVSVELLRPFDPELLSFFNLNTEEDLSEARRIAGRLRSGGEGRDRRCRPPGRRSISLPESR
jgi:molybdopterin-guanine dinucleotide biosynthesis protein A